MENLENEKVAETKQQKNEGKSESKKKNVVIKQLDPEELVINDSKALELVRKKFTDLTEEEQVAYTKCLAKVYQEEQTVRDGRTSKVIKVWRCAVRLCSGVSVARNITDDELTLIKMLNPAIISQKARMETLVKCMTGRDSNGKRFFRIVAFICDGVYIGSSKNSRNNNGFLSNVQVNNLIINNRLAKSEGSLKSIMFVESTKEVEEYLDNTLEDRYANLGSDDF